MQMFILFFFFTFLSFLSFVVATKPIQQYNRDSRYSSWKSLAKQSAKQSSISSDSSPSFEVLLRNGKYIRRNYEIDKAAIGTGKFSDVYEVRLKNSGVKSSVESKRLTNEIFNHNCEGDSYKHHALPKSLVVKVLKSVAIRKVRR